MRATKNLVPFAPTESKALQGLAMIVGFRMLGLFMLLPVLALYAEEFSGATPALIGLAIGIYGLTQALLQIPFGMISDKVGRKKVIIVGLILFAAGSVVAALSTSIYSLIAGRALQGAGAISAVSMALLADLTREEVRVRAMAVLGITIGFSFILAIVLGPLLSGVIGVSGIFWVTAALALLGIVLVRYKVPNPQVSHVHHDAQTVPKQLGLVFEDKQLLRLDYGIFALHLALTATFIAVPHILSSEVGFDISLHGWLYFGVMVSAVLVMIPLVMLAEAKGKMKPVFLFSVLLLAISQLLFYVNGHTFLGIVIALVVFFIAFNVLESVLPSLVSKTAPIQAKGTAMGVYSSAQFFGAFVGGALGGKLIEVTGDYRMAFLLSFVALLVWLTLAFTMRKPTSLGTILLKVGTMSAEKAKQLSDELLSIHGVKETVIMEEEGVAFVRIKNDEVDRDSLLKYSKNTLDKTG